MARVLCAAGSIVKRWWPDREQVSRQGPDRIGPQALALPIGMDCDVDAGVQVHGIRFLDGLDEADDIGTGLDHETGLGGVRLDRVPDGPGRIAPPPGYLGVGEDPREDRIVIGSHRPQPHPSAAQSFRYSRRLALSHSAWQLTHRVAPGSASMRSEAIFPEQSSHTP